MTSPTERTIRGETIDDTRRSIFALAALAATPFLALGLGTRVRAAEAPAAPCYNPKSFTGFQANHRKTLKFRASTDPNKRCGGCMFYSGAPDGCGKCQLLLQGPVSSNDVCDSWAKKA